MLNDKLKRLLPSAVILLALPGIGFASGNLSIDCESTVSVHCGNAPSAVFDKGNRLWTAFEQNQQVFVSYSDDYGATFSLPSAVNEKSEKVAHGGENRPKILVDSDGTLYVSWARIISSHHIGDIRFSRSTDGGRSFEPPRTINDDGLTSSHSFETLYQNQAGHLFLTWLDQRDHGKNEDYKGSAIFYAVSQDQGQTFSENFRAADHSCECCRIAVASYGSENIAIMSRQIFEESTRDHAITVLTPDGQVLETHRASEDQWQVEACPHHGPSMTQSNQSGEYHMSWFTASELHQGLYYGKFSFNSMKTDQLYRIDGNPGAGHPFLAMLQDTLYLVWKGFDGEQTTIQVIQSVDVGSSWSAPTVLMTTTEGSDHPLLVSHQNNLFLSWKSDEHGYVFQPITLGIGRVFSD
ncbi:MAG: sialidase family protein [Gammaproteobacteria bacterium]|nr:sialidase family protein [Gammaproteobacteria bacterium]